MANGMNDNLGFGNFVENQIRLGRCTQTTNNRIVRPNTDVRMSQQKIDDALQASLNTLRPSWRMCGNIVEDRVEFGKRRKGIAELHSPCLAQTARTCSSVANSPRLAAAFDAAIAFRSSVESAIGTASSLPAS
jgi:hypothetical protein